MSSSPLLISTAPEPTNQNSDPPSPDSPSGSTSSPSSRTVPLPSSRSPNRFGLALSGLMIRRPRSSSRPMSPDREIPPSPLGADSSRSGYGFPSIRRTLSKRPSSSSGNQSDSIPTPTGTQASSSGAERGGILGFGSRVVMQRSRSQPRTPISDLLRAEGGRTSRPHTASGGTTTPLLPSHHITHSRPVTAGSESGANDTHSFRLVPHLESNRSLHFDPVDRKVLPFIVVSIGRFTDRTSPPPPPIPNTSPSDPARVAFKSKVVSRGHAEIWCDETGKFLIRDTKSSSGTFLNHIRLSGPGIESKPFVIKDGDILQLGVDYQGGTEEIYRCVKMRVELNRGWQKKKSTFNTNALKQLRELGGTPTPVSLVMEPSTSNLTTVQPRKVSSVTDCCICLYPVTVCQALFIAPCSHVTHFSCIRPLINKTYPGHTCPVCRTYADLEADVTIDEESEIDEPLEPEILDTTILVDSPGELEGEELSVPLEVIGPGGVGVPLLIRSNSRSSASIKSNRSNRNSKIFAMSSSSNAVEVDGAGSIPIQSQEPIDESSLFHSTTPSNDLFLSTLAESKFNAAGGKLSSSKLSKSNSTSTSENESSSNGKGRARRNSIDSETDGTEEVSSLDEVRGKGKGKARVLAVAQGEVI